MSECSGDFKCKWCTGASLIDPPEKYGACKESQLQDEIERLTDEAEIKDDLIAQYIEATGFRPSEYSRWLDSNNIRWHELPQFNVVSMR